MEPHRLSAPVYNPNCLGKGGVFARCRRLVLLAILGVSMVHGATYHVDHAQGDDARDGLTPEQAWKRCPGDPQAAGVAATTALAPGDTVRFKGGVVYHGSIALTVSGAADQPITLDGNVDGTWGTGMAVIDGSQVIQGWKRFASAEEAGGNPRWQDLFYADIDLDIRSNFEHGAVVLHRQEKTDRQAPWQRIILCDEDGNLLPIAQFPKPKDPFYPDLPRDFLVSTQPLEVKDGVSAIIDPDNLTESDPQRYRGLFLGVHGGNNHVYFSVVKDYQPEANRLTFAAFTSKTYPKTSYAFYNGAALITEPGEWCVAPVGEQKTRFTLLPTALTDGVPSGIGFPVLLTGIAITGGASHIDLKGLCIQRFSGGGGGISVARADKRSTNIRVHDCEVRSLAGHAGIGLNYCDQVEVVNCSIHSCPAWTSGIFLSRVNDYVVRGCRLVKNSGSGIRHYECKRGELIGNAILDHYGMHSSTINVYEGCADLVIADNYLHNVLAINRNAERIVIRNNVIDSQGRSSTNISMWTSGSVGGKDISDIQIIGNTLINLSRSQDWATSVFIQRAKGASVPEGVVISDNVLDFLSDGLPAKVTGNIFLRPVGEAYLAEGGMIVEDQATLFVDPAKGDWRRKPEGPNPTVGSEIPSPPAEWAGPTTRP